MSQFYINLVLMRIDEVFLVDAGSFAWNMVHLTNINLIYLSLRASPVQLSQVSSEDEVFQAAWGLRKRCHKNSCRISWCTIPSRALENDMVNSQNILQELFEVIKYTWNRIRYKLKFAYYTNSCSIIQWHFGEKPTIFDSFRPWCLWVCQRSQSQRNQCPRKTCRNLSKRSLLLGLQ